MIRMNKITDWLYYILILGIACIISYAIIATLGGDGDKGLLDII
jgi:hypothetical protein